TNPGYDPYGYPWYSYPDPYRGYLSGAADVINAQGRFAVSQQEALYKREQVRQARMDTRRKIWEQWLWERQHRPTLNDELRRLEEAEAERARNFAPMPEIWSGKALNDLLRDLQKLQAKGPLPSVSLDQDTLDQINVTTGTGGNAGLLKSEGNLKWPVALQNLPQEDDSKELRSKVSSLFSEAINQSVNNNRVDSGVLRDLTQASKKLRERLVDRLNNVGDIDTRQYTDAKKFLDNLDGAITLMERGEAGPYITRKYSA